MWALFSSSAGRRNMENLQDMLLEHVVPDQSGHVGKIHYSFTQ